MRERERERQTQCDNYVTTAATTSTATGTASPSSAAPSVASSVSAAPSVTSSVAATANRSAKTPALGLAQRVPRRLLPVSGCVEMRGPPRPLRPHFCVWRSLPDLSSRRWAASPSASRRATRAVPAGGGR